MSRAKSERPTSNIQHSTFNKLSCALLLAVALSAAAALAADTKPSAKPTKSPKATAATRAAASTTKGATSLPAVVGSGDLTVLPAKMTVAAPSILEDTPTGLSETFNVEPAVTAESAAQVQHFQFQCTQRGVREFQVSVKPAAGKEKARLKVDLRSLDGAMSYSYETSSEATYLFYPVLEKGAYRLSASCSELAEKDRYAMTMRLDPCPVSDQLKADARKAVDKGVAYLLKSKPTEDYSHNHGIESIVLAALTGEGQKDRVEAIKKDYVDWLKALMKDTESGTWGGKKVQSFGDEELYQQALVCLGLAEAAAGGSAEAKQLLPAAMRFLLASQLTDQRCAAWKKVSRDNKSYGGWRYAPDNEDADISVTGWCMVALLAGDAAGVKEPGVRQALNLGTSFIGQCSGDTGFSYTAGFGDSGNIRDSIGALLSTLMGEDNEQVQLALKSVDYHLPSATQVDVGLSHPLYYSYYGTRLNYLRGGREWEIWRSVAMRQVLRWQKDNGAFPGFWEEATISDRYTTALSVMILRICLGDVPAYLKHEARGF